MSEVRITISAQGAARTLLLPQRRQSLAILRMPMAELKIHLEKQALENPLLEEEAMGSSSGSEKERIFENFSAHSVSLQEYLRSQLGLLVCEEEERAVAEEIVGSLDDSGYLWRELEDIAHSCRISLKATEQILKKVQSLDPPGIAARSLQECLLLQIQSRLPSEEQILSSQMIRDHWSDFVMKRQASLVKLLSCDLEKIKNAFKFISTLDPKPGGCFENRRVIAITPEIEIFRHGECFEARYIVEQRPRWAVNRQFLKTYLQSPLSGPDSQFLEQKKKEGLELILALQERERTVLRLAKYLAAKQRDFFERGLSALKALAIHTAARDLDLHPTTIWRAATEKYADTPQGVLELKQLFSGRVSGATTESRSAVKDRIRELIEKNPGSSDQKLSFLLGKQGIHVARRTVAKYRQALRLLPSRPHLGF